MALNHNQFDVEEVPASHLNEGDQLVGLYGKTYPVSGVQLNDNKTTTVTSSIGTHTVSSKLTHTIVKRPVIAPPMSVLHGRMLAEGAVAQPKKRFWR